MLQKDCVRIHLQYNLWYTPFVHFILDNVDPSILRPESSVTKFIMDKKKFDASRDIYTKFIFVREPIERLASCYNDKMIVNKVGLLQTRLGQRQIYISHVCMYHKK